MEDIVEIRIIYEKTDGINTFRDALYYTPEVYSTIDPTEIEAEKDRRFNNWLEIIKGAPESVPEIPETP